MAVSYYSTIIQHYADKVRDTLRDFNGLVAWFGSAVSEGHITTSADRGAAGSGDLVAQLGRVDQGVVDRAVGLDELDERRDLFGGVVCVDVVARPDF